MRAIVIVLDRLLRLLQLAVLAFCLMSWFPSLRGSKFYRALGRLLEPFAAPFRGISAKIRQWTGLPVDLSLWLALIALEILERILIGILW